MEALGRRRPVRVRAQIVSRDDSCSRLGGTGPAPSDFVMGCRPVLRHANVLQLRTSSSRYFSTTARCLERDGKTPREQYVHPSLHTLSQLCPSLFRGTTDYHRCGRLACVWY
jgi:hypothetical protein